MPISTKVNDLKINRLTEAQYDAAVQAGIIGENELSIITDLEAGQVIQVDTLPTASADELDKIYQYIGTTDQDYTNGYFYKCVSDGQDPATYIWENVEVQPITLNALEQYSTLPAITASDNNKIIQYIGNNSTSDNSLRNGALYKASYIGNYLVDSVSCTTTTGSITVEVTDNKKFLNCLYLSPSSSTIGTITGFIKVRITGSNIYYDFYNDEDPSYRVRAIRSTQTSTNGFTVTGNPVADDTVTFSIVVVEGTPTTSWNNLNLLYDHVGSNSKSLVILNDKQTSTLPTLNLASDNNNSLYILTNLSTNNIPISANNNIVGTISQSSGHNVTGFGYISSFSNGSISNSIGIGNVSFRNADNISGSYGGVGIGSNVAVKGGSIFIAAGDKSNYNTEGQKTFTEEEAFGIGLANNIYTVLDKDGIIPTKRLSNSLIKLSSLPIDGTYPDNTMAIYTGTTDQDYTNGYVYKSINTFYPESATCSQTVGDSLSDIVFDLQGVEPSYLNRNSDRTFNLTATDHNGNIWWNGYAGYAYYNAPASNWGLSYTGTPVVGDVIQVVYKKEYSITTWSRVDVQPQGDSLPSQTGNAGKFLTTDGTDASWSDKPLVNKTIASDSLTIEGTATTEIQSVNVGKSTSISSIYGTAIGSHANIGSNSARSIAIGQSASVNGALSIAIGSQAHTYARGAIQIGRGDNATASTVQIGLAKTDTSGTESSDVIQYRLLDSDGTIPEARLADTTSATQGQILTLDSNGNAVWANPASPVVTPQTMPELTVNGWTTDPNTGDITQTVTVQGVTATNTVFVSPYPTSATDYADAGIICITQSTNSLMFKCTTQPSNAITVNVLII